VAQTILRRADRRRVVEAVEQLVAENWISALPLAQW
jgi:hypothetical protein